MPRTLYVDIFTDDGCAAAGLPDTYPRDTAGEEIGWDACRPIGETAWKANAPGIACRSAALAPAEGGEELALFERGTSFTVDARFPFEEWFWSG